MALLALRDVPAPAKINVFLHIVGRRDDGYHLLQSFFQLIDWQDTLHFELRRDGGLSREDLGPALPADDLCLRAAKALQAASGTPLGAHIAIDKQVPWGAGLGGGSSDAASTLLALNRLWRLNWPRHRLQALAVQLGADVPFFVGGHNAWVEGIGEQLCPARLHTDSPVPNATQVLQAGLALLKPPAAIPTSAIFGSEGLPRNTAHAKLADFLAAPFGFGQNDLQQAAIDFERRRCNAETVQNDKAACSKTGNGIELAVSELKRHFGNARMTGSGSAVFAWAGFATGAQPADKIVKQLLAALPQGWSGRWCQVMRSHPLRDWAQD
jgi:4-diphosphocytidyl-2-C-methyl-D-erythritol kinase